MARVNGARHVRDRGGEALGSLAALALVCCLPMLVIAVVLLTAGGTRAGLLIPAIGAGAMIGMLMFGSLAERPHR